MKLKSVHRALLEAMDSFPGSAVFGAGLRQFLLEGRKSERILLAAPVCTPAELEFAGVKFEVVTMEEAEKRLAFSIDHMGIQNGNELVCSRICLFDLGKGQARLILPANFTEQAAREVMEHYQVLPDLLSGRTLDAYPLSFAESYYKIIVPQESRKTVERLLAAAIATIPDRQVALFLDDRMVAVEDHVPFIERVACWNDKGELAVLGNEIGKKLLRWLRRSGIQFSMRSVCIRGARTGIEATVRHPEQDVNRFRQAFLGELKKQFPELTKFETFTFLARVYELMHHTVTRKEKLTVVSAIVRRLEVSSGADGQIKLRINTLNADLIEIVRDTLLAMGCRIETYFRQDRK